MSMQLRLAACAALMIPGAAEAQQFTALSPVESRMVAADRWRMIGARSGAVVFASEAPVGDGLIRSVYVLASLPVSGPGGINNLRSLYAVQCNLGYVSITIAGGFKDAGSDSVRDMPKQDGSVPPAGSMLADIRDYACAGKTGTGGDGTVMTGVAAALAYAAKLRGG